MPICDGRMAFTLIWKRENFQCDFRVGKLLTFMVFSNCLLFYFQIFGWLLILIQIFSQKILIRNFYLVNFQRIPNHISISIHFRKKNFSCQRHISTSCSKQFREIHALPEKKTIFHLHRFPLHSHSRHVLKFFNFNEF